MGDSDDEYDRKRRDKFRGERAEVTYRGAERVARPRDDWPERDSWSRPRPREYRGGMRDRGYSPGMEPAAKRLRHDYYGEGYYNHYTPYHQAAHRAANFFREPAPVAAAEGQQPPMMSFKAFLATQDDNISESEAIEKYNDYKLEFQRQQLNEFFVAHKDHEWFRLKYHPEDSVKRKDEQMAALKKRVDVFLELLNGGKMASVSVDVSKTTDLLKLLDTVVIKLEGGNEEDLARLEQEYTDMDDKNREPPSIKESIEKPAASSNVECKKEEESTKNEKGEGLKTNGDAEEGALKSDNEDDDGEIPDEIIQPETKEADKQVEKKEEEPEQKEDTKEDKMEVDKDEEQKEEEEEESPKADEKKIDEEGADKKPEKSKKKEKKRKSSFSGSSSGSSSSSSDSEEDKDKDDEPKSEKDEKEAGEEGEEEQEKKKEKPEEVIETIIEDEKVEKPQALHKTTSIFLRSLAPTITKQEVEAICARYAGFLRVALADPQPERRWLRRGWVAFKRDANIKEICWNLNNIRLRDCELGAIVNRDLSRRIRPVNGITSHKQVVRSDINIASRVVLHLDGKVGLWPDENQREREQSFGLKSNNPVLHNITDYLIEEASAEEEELLGLEPSTENPESCIVDRDDTLISVLDKIILYLRIVHSVDYYNHCEYPNEDEMPNRCGILHARGPPPTSKTDMTQFIGVPVETKMNNFLPEKKKDENKNDVKLVHLALKDVDTEIDKFVQANTRELAKDKWLCPLSGKKFKGPDFVRKHIFNKHAEKIEEVKKEVEFFNNYLKDPKRPMMAETPHPKREEPASYNNAHTGGYSGSYGGGYNRPTPYYNQMYTPRGRGFGNSRARGGGAADYRPVIHYRDLDAPRETEEFI